MKMNRSTGDEDGEKNVDSLRCMQIGMLPLLALYKRKAQSQPKEDNMVR